MQKLFNLLASATIIILLGVIFLPKTTVSARVKTQVDYFSDITDAIDGYEYDRLSYDDVNGVFKIHYGCGQSLCLPKTINIPVDLEEITVD